MSIPIGTSQACYDNRDKNGSKGLSEAHSWSAMLKVGADQRMCVARELGWANQDNEIDYEQMKVMKLTPAGSRVHSLFFPVQGGSGKDSPWSYPGRICRVLQRIH